MKYTTDSGERINLDSQLGRGGEAIVYTVKGASDIAAKLYTAFVPNRAEKLAAMLAVPPTDPTLASGHRSICWPNSRLLDDAGTFVGFTMPRIDAKQSVNLFTIYHPKSRLKSVKGYTWRHLMTVAANLASTVSALHSKGYVVGDINESNFFVANDSRVTLIDCDSMQVPSLDGKQVYRCLVSKLEFTAPELIGKDFATTDRTPDTDNFALAVMLFLLLMEGVHPFSGSAQGSSGAPRIEDRIRSGESPYLGSNGVRPIRTAPPFEMLSPELQEAFKRAFKPAYPGSVGRPSASEWRELLHEELKHLTTCKANQYHVFSSHRKACPWCLRTPQNGQYESFPDPAVPIRSAQPISSGQQLVLGPLPNRAPVTFAKQTPAAPIATTILPASMPDRPFVIATIAVALCLCISLLIAPYLHAWGTMALTALLSLGINAWLLKASLLTISSIQRRILGKLPYAACASLGAIFFSLFPAMIDFAHSMNVWTINPFAALLTLIPFLILIAGFRIMIWPNARRVLNANGNGIGFGALLMSGLILSFLGFWIIGWALPGAWRNDLAGVQKAPSTDGSSVQAEQQINGMLTGWTGCHISNNAVCETTFYAPKVDLYFVHRNVSRAYVLKLLKAALDKGGHLNQYHLENIRVQVASPSSATVSLEKVWTSVSGADKIHHTQSQLEVVRINGSWLISSEKDISDRVETISNVQPEALNSTDIPTDGTLVATGAPTPSENQPPPVDSQPPPVIQTQNSTPAAAPSGPPAEMTGTLVRIDNRAGQMFYNVTNTSPVPFPTLTRMYFYSDSGRTGTPRGMIAQIPPLEPGQSGQIRLSFPYNPQENFSVLGDSFGRNQASQIFCRALASRFAGYAGVVLETNSFRIKMRLPCQ